MDSELDLTRLADLERTLGSGLPEIVATLVGELSSAIAQIESGLGRGDLPAVVHPAHAARNSALMLDARPMLEALHEIESGARGEQLDVAQAGLEHLRSTWPSLRRRLEHEAQRER